MQDTDERETVRNEQRGCGFLDHKKGYLRSPARSADGVLPAFVEFDPPIPYLERSKFRGYEYFPGIQFELAVTGSFDIPTSKGGWIRPSDASEGGSVPIDIPFAAEESVTTTDPPGEVWRHIARTLGDAHGLEHAGVVPQFQYRDMFMHVGKSYYDTPEEFIEEVHEQGLSKAIPVRESQEPPRIEPGRTRLFLVHPKAVYYEESETHKPGVIGYVYLSRTIFTEDEKGRFPGWAEKQASGRDDFDLVRVGDQIYSDGTCATTIDATEKFGNGDDESTDSSKTPQGESESESDTDTDTDEPESVRASEKPGRDVEGVSESSTNPPTESGIDLDKLHVEISTPDECPKCGAETAVETTGDPIDITYCPDCGGWDNSTDVNAALVEADLRRENSFNDLRTLVSEKDLNPGKNPDTDALVHRLLTHMGIL